MKSQKQISRRQFVKAAAGGAVAATGTGALSWTPAFAQDCVVPGMPTKWHKEADVVVVGAGAAGLACAIEAHDAGAKVLILEALAEAGGSMRLSGGVVYGCVTKFQKANDIVDAPEEMVKYNMAIGSNLADPDHALVWAENCGALVDWLAEMGVPFQPKPTFSGEEQLYADVAKPAPRGHYVTGAGAQLAEVLIQQVEDRDIEILYETKAQRLIAAFGEKTEVLGLKAMQGDEVLDIKANKAVMLAAGGYCTNAEFLRRFCMESLPADPNPMMLYDNGDGIMMAQALGADLFGIDNLGLRALMLIGYPDKEFAYYAQGTQVGGNIWVNLNGERFINEQMFYGKIPDILALQPEARCYSIFDAKALEDGASKVCSRFSNDLAKELEVGSVIKAGTLEELAEALELDPETLKKTVDRWNENAEKGSDPDFGKEIVGPINTPPFYAGFVKNYAGYNYGGIKINTEAQVVNWYGEVIGRLYAAGTTTGGCMGKIHLGGGNLLSKSMTFGRIAGQNAAAEKSWA